MDRMGSSESDGGILPGLRRRCEVTGEKDLYVSVETISRAYEEMLRSRILPKAAFNRHQADSGRLLHTVRWAGLTLISTSVMPIRLRPS